MRKLLLLILLLPLFAKAQVPAVKDTTLISPSTAYTPQARYSMYGGKIIKQEYINGKYYFFPTMDYLKAYLVTPLNTRMDSLFALSAKLNGGNSFTGIQQANGDSGGEFKVYSSSGIDVKMTPFSFFIGNSSQYSSLAPGDLTMETTTTGGKFINLHQSGTTAQILGNVDNIGFSVPVLLAHAEYSIAPVYTNSLQIASKGYVDSVATGSVSEYVPTTRTITAGYGLTGGGDLSANRTLTTDSTALQTVANLFPRSDTRYVKLTGSTSTGLQTIQLTTEQLRLGYDISNYTSFATNSLGQLTITPTGANTIFPGSIRVNNIYNTSNTTGSHIGFSGTTGVTIDRNVADANTTLTVTQTNASSTGNILNLANNTGNVVTISRLGVVNSIQYKLSALNTAPASSTATGTLGEIRITADSIYVCIATNTWVKTALITF